ncbi:MAG TPA: hypothetical protein VJS37_18115 [Terriglobales bacterium]|jgi:uncharacterized membrane protein|nr:hypothetical protein [Terriglobales bacterium]
MAFCVTCGSAVIDGTAFCAACGKPTGASPAPVTVAQTSSGAVALHPVNVQPAASGLSSNVAAALAYVLGFITGVLFLVLEPHKHDRFVRFHAMQSILYSAAGIVFRIGWSILVSALMDVTAWAAMLLVPVGLVISLALFVFWIFLMYQAYNHREFRIPIIGAIAAKQVG